MASPATTQESTAQARIQALDVIRGVAVLGILPVNALTFAYPFPSAWNPSLGPQAVTETTLWAWALTHIVFEQKMFSLFAMLFGASLFLVGGDGGDTVRAKTLRSRLFWLAAIGAVHGAVIWYGDILLLYACCGAVAMTMRGLPARVLLSVAGVFLAMGFGLRAAVSVFVAPADETATDGHASVFVDSTAYIEDVVAAMQAGLLPATKHNFQEWLTSLSFWPAAAPDALGLMFLGLGLFKLGFFAGRLAPPVYAGLIGAGGLALTALCFSSAASADAGFSDMALWGPASLVGYGLAPVVALSYAAALIVLVRSRILPRVINALAACGRMAFSNYLTQSLIMTSLFWSGRGLGLFGEVDRIGLWAIVLCVWALQLAWSSAWLSRFALGPFEWLWRSLTYGKPMRLRKQA